MSENLQAHGNAPFMAFPSRSVRPEEVYEYYRAGHTAGQTARHIGTPFNDTADLIVEGVLIWHAEEVKKAVRNAKLSLIPNGRPN